MTYQLNGVSTVTRPLRLSPRIKKSVSASLVSYLAHRWEGRLAHYGLHRNDEHRLALFEEAVRYAGLHLENDLARSDYWSAMPLHQRAIVLLFLVDRGVVDADDPARTPRLRAAASRGIVGRKPAFAAPVPQANARTPGRPPP